MPRPRKGPHIYRRPGRLGLYAYIDRDHRDISLGTEDEAEAHQKLSELLDGGGLRALSQGRKPLAVLFTEYRDRSRTNHTKKSAYENDLNGGRVLLWLEQRGITATDEVTKQAIEDYKTARLATKKSAARINRELTSWRQAMRMAVEQGHAHASVLGMFEMLREPRPLPNRIGLTKAEIDRFLKAEKHVGYRALFRVAVGSGLRDDELRHLDASDLRQPHLVVTPKPAGFCACCPKGWATKGYRYRSIPVTKATLAAARTLVKHRDEMTFDPKGVWKRIQAAGKAGKVKKHFSMHDLRRAYASHLLAAGYRLEQISQWLGHRDLVTTMRYLRVVDGGVIDTSKMAF